MKMMSNSTASKSGHPDFSKSQEILAKAQKIMHPVTQTLAKGPGQYSRGAAPVYLERGKGCHVWDVDGNEYIDYNMGIGPISFGYCYDKVDDAIKTQLGKDITCSPIWRGA